MTACPHNLALAHLVLRLRPLHRALRAATALRTGEGERLRAAGATAEAITPGHASALLDALEVLVDHRAISAGRSELDDDEIAMETRLRAEATAAGARLPLDAIADELALDHFECEVLALCAAVEVDADYERVFAFVHDDVARRVVSVELACGLTAGSLRERSERRAALGAHGRLRRLGLVAHTPRETGLRDELRLAPACLGALLGTPTDLRLVFRDPAEVELPAVAAVPADDELVGRAAVGLAEGAFDTIAVWGRPRAARDIVAAIATRAGLRVRRCIGEPFGAAAAAAALDAMLWIDLDAVGDRPPDGLLDACRLARGPLAITGAQPWRPPELVAARAVVEIPIVELDSTARRVLWQAHAFDATDAAVDRVVDAFRFDALEIRAASRMARATSVLRTNGHVVAVDDCLQDACVAVARKHGERHTTLVTPRRGPDDLVLPPELHARILDLIASHRALPRVMDDWGFARRVSGGGLKALFTGDSGTGKTLAAEVVARELGLPMLRVDLARVVSKWIGETEKNLDAAFEEARDSHAVLFFDEAEALFGARGDVRHGTDRYANLEVSYLLQRFEDHGGVVILATNLRDKIDSAFMRRFHLVLGFPRPGERERRKIWQRVFGPAMPLAGDLDIGALARLDLTGAGIVGAAQAAAFVAAREDAPLSMRHVVRGLVRQFQREARVLVASDLGAHAVHLGS